MLGLMQSQPLLISSLIEFFARHHGVMPRLLRAALKAICTDIPLGTLLYATLVEGVDRRNFPSKFNGLASGL